MAAGLIDRPISYQEYIYIPIYDDYKRREKLSEKVMAMNDPEMLGASLKTKLRPEKAAVMSVGGIAT